MAMTDISNATTDFAKAKEGDVLDTGPGRYRYLLLTKAPVYRADGLWNVSGFRWIATRQAFTKTVMSFWTSGGNGESA